MRMKPSREARERYNEKRRQQRAEEKAKRQVMYRLDENGEAIKDENGNSIEYLAPPPPKKPWKYEKVKSRSWAFVAYPESVPDNWLEILRLTGLEFVISPLHDSDIDATEQDKKPHWHIIAVWRTGTTTGSVAKRVSASINGVLPIPLNQVRGYYRYLTHKDDPDKYQYDDKDIQLLNGFTIANYSELTALEVEVIMDKLQEMIVELNLLEYSDLIEMLQENGLMTEMRIARKKTIFFTGYLRSRRHRLERGSSDERHR